MDSLIDHNAAFIFRHRELIDSLTKESAALRESEIRFVQAFAALPKELATKETFALFMRDIHAAHDEFNIRLQNLMQNQAGREVAESSTRAAILRKELDAAQSRIADLEMQSKKDKARIEQLDKLLKASYEDNQELNKQVEAERREHRQTREAKKKIEGNVRNIKNNYLKPLKSVKLWEQTMPFCELVRQLLQWQKGDIRRAMDLMDDNSRQQLWNIKGQMEQAKGDISPFWNSTAVSILSDAITKLEGFANAYPAGKIDMETARDKITPLLSIVDEHSDLSRLLSELERICNEVS